MMCEEKDAQSVQKSHIAAVRVSDHRLSSVKSIFIYSQTQRWVKLSLTDLVQGLQETHSGARWLRCSQNPRGAVHVGEL